MLTPSLLAEARAAAATVIQAQQRRHAASQKLWAARRARLSTALVAHQDVLGQRTRCTVDTLSRTIDITALVALPDNQHALSGSWDATVKLFNVNDGAVLRTFTHYIGAVTCLALLPDGLRFVSASGHPWEHRGPPPLGLTARIAYHGLAP